MGIILVWWYGGPLVKEISAAARKEGQEDDDSKSSSSDKADDSMDSASNLVKEATKDQISRTPVCQKLILANAALLLPVGAIG
jgi:hypothetical protein